MEPSQAGAGLTMLESCPFVFRALEQGPPALLPGPKPALGQGGGSHVRSHDGDDNGGTPEGQPVPAPAGQPPSTRAPGSRTVLVAEDNEAMRDLVTEVLRERGYRVLAARDGEEAIALAESQDLQFDLVVTDEVMPRARGSALAARVRLRWAKMPVLVISGQHVDADALRRDLGPGIALLRKPFTPAELIAALDALMNEGG